MADETKTMNDEAKATTQELKQFVCFKLANEEYGIDINNIQEVIRLTEIAYVPQMPDFCLGVMNIRGDITAVFVLRKMFQLEEKAFDDRTKIIAVSLNNNTVGLLVDEILENVKLESSRIDPTPQVKMQIKKECIEGLGQLDNRMIVILDLQHIHEHVVKVIDEIKAQNKGEKS